MQANTEKLEEANKYADGLLKTHTDRRLQIGIKNVQTACLHHINKGMAISITSIAEFVRVNCAGRPAKGTLDNDSKGIYKPLIDKYCEAASRSRKSKKNNNSAGDGTPQNKIYIRQLEARITHLEKVLSKNFDNQGKVSLTNMLNSEITEEGTVEVAPASKFTVEEKQGVKGLLDLVTQSNDYEIRGEGDRQRIVSIADGKILITPNDLSVIRNIIHS